MIRFLLVLIPLIAAGETLGQPYEGKDLGAIVPELEEFHRVIDERCTICHSREPVETAINQRREMQALLETMVERGAFLSERDKEVLGTFWGSPFKTAPAPTDEDKN